MSPTKILFRCDASPSIGAGHVMRCLAFADSAASLGWACTFATGPETLETVPLLATRGHRVEIIDGKADLVMDEEVAAVVVDHYGLGEAYERRLAGAGRTVVVFDDAPSRPHACDILLDSAPGRPAEDYRPMVGPQARVLIGPRYAMLGNEWRMARAAGLGRFADGAPVRRILVSMGSTDPSDATSRVLAAIRAAKIDADIDIILGAGARHIGRVSERLDARTAQHVNPPSVSAIAGQADMAIGAPGSSSYERAAIGLPSIMVMTADNQRFIARAFAELQAADVLPPAMLDDPEAFGARIAALAGDAHRRTAMSKAAAAVTDGRGPLRLLMATLPGTATRDARHVRLRLAERTDEAWLLELQSQPATRRYARNPAVPTPAEHARWFARVLDAANTVLGVMECGDDPVGMIRLDRKPQEPLAFEISIAISDRFHGKGIGSAGLRLARSLAPTADILATVLPENKASLALFASAGYRPEAAVPDLYRQSAGLQAAVH